MKSVLHTPQHITPHHHPFIRNTQKLPSKLECLRSESPLPLWCFKMQHFSQTNAAFWTCWGNSLMLFSSLTSNSSWFGSKPFYLNLIAKQKLEFLLLRRSIMIFDFREDCERCMKSTVKGSKSQNTSSVKMSLIPLQCRRTTPHKRPIFRNPYRSTLPTQIILFFCLLLTGMLHTTYDKVVYFSSISLKQYCWFHTFLSWPAYDVNKQLPPFRKPFMRGYQWCWCWVVQHRNCCRRKIVWSSPSRTINWFSILSPSTPTV